MLNGGRFDFDDGGTFCGGWEEGWVKNIFFLICVILKVIKMEKVLKKFGIL